MVSGEFESFGCSVMGFFRGARVIQSHCSSLADKDINNQRRFEVEDDARPVDGNGLFTFVLSEGTN